MTTGILSEVDQLTEGAAFTSPRRSAVAVRGRDASGFLHRMSTQHLESLSPGDATLSCLVNRQGRVVDVVHHMVCDTDHIVLLGASCARPGLLAWLDSFLFAEKVELEELAGRGALALLAGATAAEVAERVAAAPPPRPWAMVEGQGLRVVRTLSLGSSNSPVPCFLLWSPSLEQSVLERRLVDEGVHQASSAAFETWRIAAGVPGEVETDGRANPLELALHDAIHWSKGCYIGQEVLARIDNYGKQARQLISLRTEELAGITVGDDVWREGTVVGEVTSVAPASWAAAANLLALVRHKGESAGVAFEVGALRRGVTGVPRAAAQSPHD